MCDVRTRIVLVAIIVWLGSLHCQAVPCTQEAIIKCRTHWDHGQKYCVNMEERRTCLESIDECEGEVLENDRFFSHEDSVDNARKCEGMEDGGCFALSLVTCLNGIVGRENTQEKCLRVGGKIQDALSCLDDLRASCPDLISTDRLDTGRDRLQKVEMECKGIGGNHETIDPADTSVEDYNESPADTSVEDYNESPADTSLAANDESSTGVEEDEYDYEY